MRYLTLLHCLNFFHKHYQNKKICNMYLNVIIYLV